MHRNIKVLHDIPEHRAPPRSARGPRGRRQAPADPGNQACPEQELHVVPPRGPAERKEGRGQRRDRQRQVRVPAQRVPALACVTLTSLPSCDSFRLPRCSEAMTLFETNSTQRCPIVDMIELLPDTYKVGRLRRKLAHLSSVVSLSFIFSFRSHVHCIICFLRQHLLDSCVRESDDDHNSADYHVILQLSHAS